MPRPSVFLAPVALVVSALLLAPQTSTAAAAASDGAAFAAHLLYDVRAHDGGLQQRNTRIANLSLVHRSGAWKIEITGALVVGKDLGIKNFTPKCTITGAHGEVTELYARIRHAINDVGFMVICTQGKLDKPASTTIDLASDKGIVELMDSP